MDLIPEVNLATIISTATSLQLVKLYCTIKQKVDWETEHYYSDKKYSLARKVLKNTDKVNVFSIVMGSTQP